MKDSHIWFILLIHPSNLTSRLPMKDRSYNLCLNKKTIRRKSNQKWLSLKTFHNQFNQRISGSLLQTKNILNVHILERVSGASMNTTSKWSDTSSLQSCSLNLCAIFTLTTIMLIYSTLSIMKVNGVSCQHCSTLEPQSWQHTIQDGNKLRLYQERSASVSTPSLLHSSGSWLHQFHSQSLLGMELIFTGELRWPLSTLYQQLHAGQILSSHKLFIWNVIGDYASLPVFYTLLLIGSVLETKVTQCIQSSIGRTHQLQLPSLSFKLISLPWLMSSLLSSCNTVDISKKELAKRSAMLKNESTAYVISASGHI